MRKSACVTHLEYFVYRVSLWTAVRIAKLSKKVILIEKIDYFLQIYSNLLYYQKTINLDDSDTQGHPVKYLCRTLQSWVQYWKWIIIDRYTYVHVSVHFSCLLNVLWLFLFLFSSFLAALFTLFGNLFSTFLNVMVLSTRSHNYLALHLWTEAYEERNETKTTIHKQLYVRCARIETQQRKWIYFKHMHDNLSKNNERWIRFYGNWNWHKTSEWINERNIQEKVIIWLCLVFCVFRCWFLSLFFFLQFFF